MFLDTCCTGDCYVTQYSLHCYVTVCTAMLQFALLCYWILLGGKLKARPGWLGLAAWPSNIRRSGEMFKKTSLHRVLWKETFAKNISTVSSIIVILVFSKTWTFPPQYCSAVSFCHLIAFGKGHSSWNVEISFKI